MLKTFYLLSLFCLASSLLAVEIPPPLRDATPIPDFQIETPGDERTFQLPQLPPKTGMVTVLRCRLSSYGNGGCNYCARITFNNTPLGMLTSGGRPRLLFRELTFKLNEAQWKDRTFKIFNGSNIELPFAHDCDDADRRTADGLGSWFVFDLTDAAHPVDVNTVTFRNIRVNLGGNNSYALTVKDASVGYLPSDLLPKSAHKTLKPGKSLHSLTAHGVSLDIFRNGGFAVAFPGLPAYVVETGIGMKLGTEPTLHATDQPPPQPATSQQLDDSTFLLTTNWPHVQLEQTLTITADGRLDWLEKWTSLDSDKIRGIPLRHRTGLANTETRNWLRGSAEVLEAELCANATVFHENMQHPGSGCAFASENDLANMLLNAVNDNGIIEIFSPVLALAPGKSVTLHFSVTPVPEGGYWKFINDLRRRRGIGRYGVERPCFWGAAIPAVPGLNNEECIRKALGSLGKITVAFTPWFGHLDRDSLTTPPQPGTSVLAQQEAFRRDGHQKIAEKIARYRRLLPDAKIMLLHHPSMRMTYMPEFAKNPLRISAIRNPDGSPYHHEGYDSIILKDKCRDGWAIIYYLPLPGSPWYNRLMEDVNFAIASGADGMYFDEFSFLTPRNYRRYDYSSWDGFSADLDDSGNVVTLKSDNAYTTQPFKSALEQRLAGAGKLLLGNGGECGLGADCSQAQGFIEGTALINMPQGHLLHVPLVLGNYGTEGTRPGVLKAVREALSLGCIYSPHVRTNTVLEGPDNFVCKLYPVTVTEIGPGFVAAKERFCTAQTGTFVWTGTPDGKAELFIYDADGNRLAPGSTAPIVNGRITLEVPAGGLVIAERK